MLERRKGKRKEKKARKEKKPQEKAATLYTDNRRENQTPKSKSILHENHHHYDYNISLRLFSYYLIILRCLYILYFVFYKELINKEIVQIATKSCVNCVVLSPVL